MDQIEPGLAGTARMMVGTSDTAPRIGSGHISVLATPRMIGLMEEAALAAVERLLPAGKQSLGARMDVSHTAATPVGMTVEAVAELTAVEGRRLTFALTARDETEIIGQGTHERVVVTAASFQARIDAKRAR